MKNILSLIILIGFLTPITAQTEFPLYADKIPNARNVSDKEQIVDRKKEDRAAIDTSVPTLTFFKPDFPNGKVSFVLVEVMPERPSTKKACWSPDLLFRTASLLLYLNTGFHRTEQTWINPWHLYRMLSRLLGWFEKKHLNLKWIRVKLASWDFLPGGTWPLPQQLIFKRMPTPTKRIPLV